MFLSVTFLASRFIRPVESFSSKDERAEALFRSFFVFRTIDAGAWYADSDNVAEGRRAAGAMELSVEELGRRDELAALAGLLAEEEEGAGPAGDEVVTVEKVYVLGPFAAGAVIGPG